MLHLFEFGDRPLGSDSGSVPEVFREQSDKICSALQLINFWQDVAVDWEKGRVYIPQEDLRALRRDESDIAARNARPRRGAT